ncbi:hypothetical protein Afil01_53980 [Actinorhabdospora filicis]|uniref:DUF1579 domain-containing protein n=1 Tax=Actinorhabdospora filicis TaxID=1785913 RepID=A0A9W6STR1_9ACTN|nr:hypothetical protein [Actinorhabdospora filicis]GLZ80591.1 hypothetical protein Afil01_53980 [Actinorhabdospora filicis]
MGHRLALMSDFEFLTGDWIVANRLLVHRLAGGEEEWRELDATAHCHTVFEGGANFDEIVFADGSRGCTLRLFDPATGLWSLYWSNNATGRLFPPVTGRFADGVGVFEGEEEHEGRLVKVRYIWSRVDTGTPRWEQAYSGDGGATWERNWVMDFRRP